MNYIQYLNRDHNYQTSNCLTLICEFYEKELGIIWDEERKLFNNFSLNSFGEIRKVPVGEVYNLRNWIKINLTEIQEFDIIVYTRNLRLSHFAMYAGNFKILDLVESQKSVLRHFNDQQRNNIDGVIRHRSLVT